MSPSLPPRRLLRLVSAIVLLIGLLVAPAPAGMGGVLAVALGFFLWAVFPGARWLPRYWSTGAVLTLAAVGLLATLLYAVYFGDKFGGAFVIFAIPFLLLGTFFIGTLDRVGGATAAEPAQQ